METEFIADRTPQTEPLKKGRPGRHRTSEPGEAHRRASRKYSRKKRQETLNELMRPEERRLQELMAARKHYERAHEIQKQMFDENLAALSSEEQEALQDRLEAKEICEHLSQQACSGAMSDDEMVRAFSAVALWWEEFVPNNDLERFGLDTTIQQPEEFAAHFLSWAIQQLESKSEMRFSWYHIEQAIECGGDPNGNKMAKLNQFRDEIPRFTLSNRD